MINIGKIKIFRKILSYGPVLLLFTSVLNQFDFNYLGIKYFSFNFTYILVFYWSLKKSNGFNYGTIFLAGLVNDVVTTIPIGVSSLLYLLICGFAAYLKNITLRPNLIKDWIFFLVTILVVNSISYILLTLFFLKKINYFDLLINSTFTFLLYFIFSYLFTIYSKIIYESSNA